MCNPAAISQNTLQEEAYQRLASRRGRKIPHRKLFCFNRGVAISGERRQLALEPFATPQKVQNSQNDRQDATQAWTPEPSGSSWIMLFAGDAGLDKAVPPARDQLAPDGHLCGDWLILPTVGGEQDNLGSQREANRDPPAAGVSLQLLALGFGQCHSWCCSHLFLLPDEDLANNL